MSIEPRTRLTGRTATKRGIDGATDQSVRTPAQRSGWVWVALVLSGLLGLGLGLFAGASSAVERAALGAVGRLERRFGVALDAGQVNWTWGGRVEIVDASVRVGGAVIATSNRVLVDAEVDWIERRVRIVSVGVAEPALWVVRRSDGTTNLDGILAGLERARGSGTGSAWVSIDPTLPEVAGQGARVVIDHGVDGQPLGLAVPPRVELRAGKLGLRIEGDRTAVVADFADSSLDPGESIALELIVDRSQEGRKVLEKVAVRPSRPLRFWLGARVVGLGGVALTRTGFELGPLQLSVPVKAGSDEAVSAAATFERIAVDTSDPIALARSVAQNRGKGLAETLASLGPVTVTKPVVALTFDGGHHGFEDLLPAGPTTLPEAGRLDFVSTVTTAAIEASEALIGPVEKTATPRSVAERVSAVVGKLSRIGVRPVRLAKVLRAIPLENLTIAQGELLLATSGQEFGITDIGLTLGRDGADRTIKTALSFAGTNAGRLTVDARVSEAAFSARVSAQEMTLEPWVKVLGLGERVQSGLLGSLEAQVSLPLESGAMEVQGQAEFRDLVAIHPAVASEPMRFERLSMSGKLALDPTTERLSIEEGLVTSRGVGVAIVGRITSALSRPHVALSMRLPETPAQSLFDALPKGFATALDGLRLEGSIAWDLEAEADLGDPKSIKVDSRPVAQGFSVLDYGVKVDFERLRISHTYGVRLADDSTGERVVGPATGSWIPLSQISPYLPAALTTTEDGTFYTNEGISTFAMKDSLATNLERGGFVRGASTITQQLVKNLFLGGRKTIARKLQEVFIAWQMSKRLSKDEVMALYLNAIEFGPGIYGIGDAAWHWFGKRPSDLTLPEAVFLASIVPGPRRYYSFFQQGGITPRWKAYLESLIKVMVERKKITSEEQSANPVDINFRGARGEAAEEIPEGFDEIPERDEQDIEDGGDPR